MTYSILRRSDSPSITIQSLLHSTPPFQFTHLPRKSSNFGSGIDIISISFINISTILDLQLTTSEAFRCTVSAHRTKSFNVFLFYCPSSPNLSEFLNEFRVFASQLSPNSILLSDFNIPVNSHSSLPFTKQLSNCNLTQYK